MAIQGKLIEVKTKTGKTKGKSWTMYQYCLDNGKTYSSFKKYDVQKGDTVNVSFENKNGSWEVADIRQVQSPQPAKQEQHKQTYSPEREINIVRQSSIKAAVDIVINGVDINKVIAVADLIVEYCLNGKSELLQEKLAETLITELDANVESDEDLECGI